MTDLPLPPFLSPLLAEDERLDTVNEKIRLIQKKQGLTFGTDAFLLAAFVKSAPKTHAVDLGSGTGILPLLLLAKGKIKSATAVEVQPAFADLIARNAKLNGFAEGFVIDVGLHLPDAGFFDFVGLMDGLDAFLLHDFPSREFLFIITQIIFSFK